MKIQFCEIPISEIVKDYEDNDDNGVKGFGGKLDIRPAYQRQFVYKEAKRDEVIRSIRNDFPISILYFAKTGDILEVLDGQQRIISICQYVNNEFSVLKQDEDYPKLFINLTEEQKIQILNYKLKVYICEGTPEEKLKWFKIINISGEPLTNQELLNASYTGTWLSSAKGYFSKKTNNEAMSDSRGFVKGDPNRQEILELALKWIADLYDTDIANYMAKNQHEENADELINYFKNVMKWAKSLFPEDDSVKKSIQWGNLYNRFRNNTYNKEQLAEDLNNLMSDSEVTNKKGIYLYLLSGKSDEKLLSLRTFTDSVKKQVLAKQKSKCKLCGKPLKLKDAQADHIIPWSKGGRTTEDNCQILCQKCNIMKSNRDLS